jgi:hypothetical protein
LVQSAAKADPELASIAMAAAAMVLRMRKIPQNIP